MIIKILGTWCPKCKLLQRTVEEAVKELELKCKIIKVDNMEKIMQYDIIAMPGLVIDEKVVITGRIPDKDEMNNILTNRK